MIARLGRLLDDGRADPLRADVRRRAPGRRAHARRDGGAGRRVRRVAAIVNAHSRGRPQLRAQPRAQHVVRPGDRAAGADRATVCGDRGGDRPAVLDLPKLEEFFLRAEAARHERRRSTPSTARSSRRPRPGCRSARGPITPIADAGRALAPTRSWSGCGGCWQPGIIRRIGAVPNHYRLGYRRQRHVGLGRRRTSGSPSSASAVGALRLRQPLLPPPAPPAGVALQPVRHGARQEPRRGRGPGGRDRRAAGRRGARPRRALQHPDPQEDRPATCGEQPCSD